MVAKIKIDTDASGGGTRGGDALDYRAELGERLSQVIEMYETKSAAAATAGVSAEQLNKWIRGSVKVPIEAVRTLSRGVNVDFSWVATGEGKMPHSMHGQSQFVTMPGSNTADGHIDGRVPSLEVPSRMVRLPIYQEVQASAGPGAAPVSELADGVISFEPLFLRNHGATPERCVVIWARGDSMMPTIPNGAALVVDQSQTDISNGCIMVIGVGDDLLVKRIRRRLDGLIDLISDNAAYPPETLGPDALRQLRVVGRVVYFCRTP